LLGGAAAAWPRSGGEDTAHRCADEQASRRSGEEPTSQRSYRACNPWTRSIAATCGSTSGGPRAEPRTFANTPRSSSFQRSSWHWAGRSSGRRYRRPYRAGSVHADPRSGRRRLCREPGEARPQCHGIPRSSTGANPKWLEVLREIVSRVTQTAVLRDRAIHEGLGQFP
jgi:hypothetical protein